MSTTTTAKATTTVRTIYLSCGHVTWIAFPAGGRITSFCVTCGTDVQALAYQDSEATDLHPVDLTRPGETP